MFRLTSVSLVALAITGVAGAAQIQLGGASGLTAAYINQTSGAGQNACAAGAGNCIAGGVGDYAERSYATTLFASSTPALADPLPFVGYSGGTGGQASGKTIADFSGETFAMISDGVGNASRSNNYWAPTISSTMTIPVGVFGVESVWTMLNNQRGRVGPNVNETSLVFYFGSASNNANGKTLTVDLFNVGNTAQEGATGQIRSSLECSGFSSPATACPATASGALTSSSFLTGVLGGTASGSTTVNVLARNVMSTSYSTAAGLVYQNTSGNVVLDDQGFIFGTSFATDWLVKIDVVQKNSAAGTGPTSPGSQTSLSAITVETVPEPSTILLVLSGIGALGFKRFRRK